MRRAMLTVVVLSMIQAGPAMLAWPEQDTPKPAAEATETPAQFYLRYRNAVLHAAAMDDVLGFWRTEMVKEFQQAPPEQRADLEAIQRIYRSRKDVRVTNETVGAIGATVFLEASGPEGKRMTGTAYLVKENTGWKLFGPEQWK